jgi:hypothetical protein
MDPLVIARGIGKLVDAVLGHGEPLGGTQILADGAKHGGNGIESDAHDAAVEVLRCRATGWISKG